MEINEIRLAYKAGKKSAPCKNPEDIFEYIKTIWEKDPSLSDTMDLHETFVVLALDMGNKIIGYRTIAIGSAVGVIVCPKKVFQSLLLVNAQQFICVHNHPSGRVEPSEADKFTTDKLVKLSVMMEMKCLDHFIIANDEVGVKYYSFMEMGDI